MFRSGRMICNTQIPKKSFLYWNQPDFYYCGAPAGIRITETFAPVLVCAGRV